jgi:hypothetical protein
MTSDEILDNIKNKSFSKIAVNIKKLTAVEQFILNGQWTDYLQSLVDYGNKHLTSVERFSIQANYGGGLKEDDCNI